VSNILSSLPSLLRLTLERDRALTYITGEVPAPTRPYASPWPDALPALGPRAVGPFDLCADCGTGTWVRYGPRPLCLRCANLGRGEEHDA
jgi:hypothetical protein